MSIAILAVLLLAQQPDTARILSDTRAAVARLPELRSIWPGFRPDTIPAEFILPPGGSTSVMRDGRLVARIVVDTPSAPALAAVQVHEAFHVLQRSSVRPGTWFGVSEDSWRTSAYPMFDVENEADALREGRLLAAALRAGTDGERRRLVRRFIALRSARHARIDSVFARFEQQAELNEGLAQYAQNRAAHILAGRGGEWQRNAAREDALLRSGLENLIGDADRSVRLRFYRTGAAIALLLDRLEPGWKQGLLAREVTLQELLAHSVDAPERDAQLLAAARASAPDAEAIAAAHVAQIRARRLALADSLLARRGARVTIDLRALPRQTLGMSCGFDPQNMLTTGADVLIHTRYLKVCIGSGFEVELNAAVVQDSTALRTVVQGPLVLRTGDEVIDWPTTPAELRGVTIEGSGLKLRASRARISRAASAFTVEPLATP